jgi:ABC-type proline/glycine betaine transport system permease subunit
MKLRNCPQCGAPITFLDVYFRNPDNGTIRCRKCFSFFSYSTRHLLIVFIAILICLILSINFLVPHPDLRDYREYVFWGSLSIALLAMIAFHAFAPLRVEHAWPKKKE